MPGLPPVIYGRGMQHVPHERSATGAGKQGGTADSDESPSLLNRDGFFSGSGQGEEAHHRPPHGALMGDETGATLGRPDTSPQQHATEDAHSPEDRLRAGLRG